MSLTKNDLIQYLCSGCKPPSDWRIGVEHEKFLYTQEGKRADYNQHIAPLLQSIAHEQNWTPLLDQGKIIGLHKGQASITLEPGGQFELSGSPLSSLKEIKAELQEHFSLLEPYLKKYGLTMVFKGYDSLTPPDQVPLMPKQRYGIMLPYMSTKGSLGHEMMLNTCTVQVNLDFSSEEDMVMKFRVSVALQGLATALFANSPYSHQGISYQSYRRHIWNHTDQDRCGLPLFVFDQDMGFEKYVDFALSVPMYFVVRNGKYLNREGLSFKDFMEGKLPHDEEATLTDWVDHLTTIFTEVRLKTYLEMRGADTGPLPFLMALPAFWIGLLYDKATLKQAYAWIQTWSVKDIITLSQTAPLILKSDLKELALKALDLSSQGLQGLEKGAGAYLSPLYQRLVD